MQGAIYEEEEKLFFVIIDLTTHQRGGNLPTAGADVVLVATSSSATEQALRQFSPLVGAQPRGGEAFQCKLWESSRSKLLTWSRLREMASTKFLFAFFALVSIFSLLLAQEVSSL